MFFILKNLVISKINIDICKNLLKNQNIKNYLYAKKMMPECIEFFIGLNSETSEWILHLLRKTLTEIDHVSNFNNNINETKHFFGGFFKDVTINGKRK